MSKIQKQHKARIIIALLFIATLFLPGMAGAFGGGMHHGQGGGMGNGPEFGCGIWQNPQLVKDLGLSDDQVTKLKDLEYAHREKQLGTHAKLSALRLQMDKAMSSKPVDEDTVRDLAKKISDLRSEKDNERIEFRLSLQKVLTPEQAEKLDQFRMAHCGKGLGQGKGKDGQHGRGYENCPRNQSDKDDDRFLD